MEAPLEPYAEVRENRGWSLKGSDSGGISSRISTGWVRREHSTGPLPRSQERTGGRRLSVYLLGPLNDPRCLSRFLRAQRSCYSGDTPSLAAAAKTTPAATHADGPGAGGDLEAPGWGAARRQSGDTGKDEQPKTPALAREGRVLVALTDPQRQGGGARRGSLARFPPLDSRFRSSLAGAAAAGADS